MVLAIVQVAGSLGAAHAQPERRPIDLLAVALLLTGPVALALLTRDRVPAVTVVVGAATATYLVLGYPYGPVVLSLVVALVAAVRHRSPVGRVARRRRGAAAHGVAVVLDPDRAWSWPAATATLAWALLVLALAEVGRVRRERAVTYRRALAEERRRRAGEDRLRIAQELHDVVAHHMSLINVQASVALHLRGTAPRAGRRGAAGHQGREQGGARRAAFAHRGAPRGRRAGPAPAGREPRGARRPRRTHPVRRPRPHDHVTGEPEPLPAGVELTAYRVVQESVTNVVRHCGRPAGPRSRSGTAGDGSRSGSTTTDGGDGCRRARRGHRHPRDA